MECIELRPEKEQKTMWFIGWTVPFFIVLVLLVVFLAVIPPGEAEWLVLLLCLVGWLVVMGLILVWIPAYYKSLEYLIDSDSIKMKKGVFWKKNVTIPFTKITNLDVTEGPVQRMFGIGTIKVQTAGAGGQQGAQPELKLLGVRDLEGVKDSIMERVRGYTISGSSEVKEKAAEGGDSEILGRMLEELTAIREVLEKKRS